MSGQRADESTTAFTMRQIIDETIEQCARVADAHKGNAAKKRRERGQKLHMGIDGYEEVVAEERGEDIASEMIAKAIRSMTSTMCGEEK